MQLLEYTSHQIDRVGQSGEAPLIEEKTKASNNVLILDRGVHGSQVLLTL